MKSYPYEFYAFARLCSVCKTRKKVKGGLTLRRFICADCRKAKKEVEI